MNSITDDFFVMEGGDRERPSNPTGQAATHRRFVPVSPYLSVSIMISRSRSLPVFPSAKPPLNQRERRHSVSGAIHGAPVRPSAPADTTATEQVIVVSAHRQQPAVAFDVSGLPLELQRLIFAAICNPHGACTLEQLQAALKAFKAAGGVNRSFYREILPLLHATFLRLFGVGRIKGASLDSLPQNLHQILEGIVARSGLSGLQCLSDLVNGSLGTDPNLARKAFAHWIHLATTAMATTALPYQALPTLIAVRLGEMLQRPGVPPTHALMLMKQLVHLAKTGGLPPHLAMPALIEVALVVQTQELVMGGPFRAPPELGRSVQWVALGWADVMDAMDALGCLGAALSLLDVAQVLATPRKSWGETLTQATVLNALNYLADCPHPLLGCLAEALDIIQCLGLGHDPHVEELLARCAEKRASARLLAVEGSEASGSIQVTPLAGA
jgi:hypothetical protein